jgi:tripartite-type tricarboxylate transporter receptor subunit TctC
VVEVLRGQGLEPTGLGPDAFARFLREDLVRWRTLIHDLGIKSEN